ncbi:hypothetical protein BDV18DRAFT_141720 [Aspergillus unguis]
METYLQYQRVRRAVCQALSEVDQTCPCHNPTVGSMHQPSCVLLSAEKPRGEVSSLPVDALSDNVILVSWNGPNDALNPANASVQRKLAMTFLVSLITLTVCAASAIDACGVREYSQDFHVSKVVGSLATGLFLVGLAFVLFGYGITSIFIICYMYLIDAYGTYSASALGSLVFTRYVAAGGISVAGAPIYEALGVPYTLTIMGSISGVMAAVPYLLYFFGPRIRARSKYAVGNEDAISRP